MKRRMWPRALPVMALIILALLLFALSGRTPPGQADVLGVVSGQTSNQEALEADIGLASDFSFPSLAVFDPVVNDNLFSATRTAPPRGPERNSAPQQQNAQLSLSGVVLSGDKRSAILLDNATARMMNITVGESFRGWELVSVDSEGVILRQNGAEVTLSISFAPEDGDSRGPMNRLQINTRIGGGPVPVVPRRGDSQGNPVPAIRQSIDPDRIEQRGGRF